jgi:hypothetical protein
MFIETCFSNYNIFLNKKTMFLIKQTIYLFEQTSISTGRKLLQYATKIAKLIFFNQSVFDVVQKYDPNERNSVICTF